MATPFHVSNSTQPRRTPASRGWSARAVLAGLLTLVPFLQWLPVASLAQERPGSTFERIVPYVPTPPEIVEKMLVLAKVDSHDRVYDLGSGDGRIVIMAAQKFGAQAVGIELDQELVDKSTERIAKLGLEKRAKIIHGDIFNSDFGPATVVTLYLLTRTNERLRPILERQLRPGTRIVSHDYQVPGWKPEQEVKVISDNGISHTLYLYARP